jgi:hypothetical protein
LIAQIWRGVTRATDREACVAQLLAGIHTALVDARTCKGAYLLARRTDDADVELMVLTLFGGAAASPCGEDEALYRTAVFDRPLPCAFNKSVAVYEILTEPRRTLSYANLRRRFPLRLMGPR